jgi:CheY-like chemotaxis protein
VYLLSGSVTWSLRITGGYLHFRPNIALFPSKIPNQCTNAHTAPYSRRYRVAPIARPFANTYADKLPNSGKQTHSIAPRAKRWQHKSTTSQPPTLVWIDDYKPGLGLYKEIYEELGYRVFTASRGIDGLRILAAYSADAVIVDYEMPGMDGGKVAKSIKQRWPSIPVIMFSGCAVVPNGMANVVDAFCDKAGRREDLLIAIQTVLQKKQNHYSTSSLGLQAGQVL